MPSRRSPPSSWVCSQPTPHVHQVEEACKSHQVEEVSHERPRRRACLLSAGGEQLRRGRAWVHPATSAPASRPPPTASAHTAGRLHARRRVPPLPQVSGTLDLVRCYRDVGRGGAVARPKIWHSGRWGRGGGLWEGEGYGGTPGRWRTAAAGAAPDQVASTTLGKSSE